LNAAAFTAWRSAFKAIIGPFLFSRLWVAIFVYLGHSHHVYLSPVLGGWEGVSNWWLNPWTTYDSKHFLDIAQHGYTAHTAPFFPLYAFLLRLLGNDIVHMAAWGILLSNAAFLLALMGLYRLTDLQYDARTARVAVLLTAFFPSSPYFSAVYSESVFLLLLVATLWCLSQKQWAWAALWSFAAALTRSAGVLLFAGLCIQYAVEFFRSKRARPLETESAVKQPSPLRALAVIAPLMGFLAAQFLIALQVGDATQGVTAHQQYFRALSWPWMPIILDFWDLITLPEWDIVMPLNLVATMIALILFWKYRLRQPIAYSVMLLGLLLMQLTYSHYSIPRTQSSLRLLSTMIPFLLPLSCEISKAEWPPFRRRLVIAVGLLVAALSAHIFGQKQFLG